MPFFEFLIGAAVLAVIILIPLNLKLAKGRKELPASEAEPDDRQGPAPQAAEPAEAAQPAETLGGSSPPPSYGNADAKEPRREKREPEDEWAGGGDKAYREALRRGLSPRPRKPQEPLSRQDPKYSDDEYRRTLREMMRRGRPRS